MDNPFWIVLTLFGVFSVWNILIVMVGLYLYHHVRQTMLLALCQSLLQIERANLILTPKLLRDLLTYHKPPRDIEDLLISAYGRDRMEWNEE